LSFDTLMILSLITHATLYFLIALATDTSIYQPTLATYEITSWVSYWADRYYYSAISWHYWRHYASQPIFRHIASHYWLLRPLIASHSRYAIIIFITLLRLLAAMDFSAIFARYFDFIFDFDCRRQRRRQFSRQAFHIDISLPFSDAISISSSLRCSFRGWVDISLFAIDTAMIFHADYARLRLRLPILFHRYYYWWPYWCWLPGWYISMFRFASAIAAWLHWGHIDSWYYWYIISLAGYWTEGHRAELMTAICAITLLIMMSWFSDIYWVIFITLLHYMIIALILHYWYISHCH